MLKEIYNIISTYLIGIVDFDYIFVIFLATTFASIAYFMAITYIITQMDSQYFIRKEFPNDIANKKKQLTSMSRSITYVISLAKVMIGIVLIVSGLVMLVLPGQGIITLLIGLSLVPLPGKNKIEKNLLARKSVQHSLNWIRVKANKAPFIFD
ncbi:PGPGW domain-containing protein [Colwellia sp. 1_MG-2023]|uniref:PGPGW domain-containing protein n=1 Tax=unclassified Colwellia TaxID=196834 RepID=UPI001C09175F|nr:MULTISPECIES: PGPGW domain-containing protein [unclassified Colwellia]MBU2924791.1 PGPGW domain-containing protein [Colwellia sp. C2M11]MDO6653864.1 PGPGW domain-containing protein [Colwellia sp. 3_MG-2023]MDO6667119.1 PGPGW domain-containing protein [Colwellia sp. 2_MG-2023]MDO6691464.1 PGPGW domain-containing protein [Colwellia sp. 1_MG-2023]